MYLSYTYSTNIYMHAGVYAHMSPSTNITQQTTRVLLCTHNKFYFEEEFEARKKKKKKKNGLAAHTQPTGRLTNQWHNNSAQCGAHGP